MIPDIHRVGQHAFIYATARTEQVLEWLKEQLGGRYEYLVEDHGAKISFEGPAGTITAAGHIVASVAVEPQTLLWRWTPAHNGASAGAVGGAESAGIALPGSGAADAMRSWGEQQGLPGFTTQEVPYQPIPDAILHVAQDVSHSAFEIFGCKTVYIHVSINEAGSRAVYLLENFSRPLPELDLDALAVKLPRLISECDDPAWSIDGIGYQRPDWHVQEVAPLEKTTRSWRISDANGRSFVIGIALDEHNRVAYSRLEGPTT